MTKPLFLPTFSVSIDHAVIEECFIFWSWTIVGERKVDMRSFFRMSADTIRTFQILFFAATVDFCLFQAMFGPGKTGLWLFFAVVAYYPLLEIGESIETSKGRSIAVFDIGGTGVLAGINELLHKNLREGFFFLAGALFTLLYAYYRQSLSAHSESRSTKH